MKKIISILLLLFIISISYAQDIVGSWSGEIEMNGNKLGFVFHITQNGDVYESTLDIPMQGLTGAKADITTFVDGKLAIGFPEFQIVYEGTIDKNNEIIGHLAQASFQLPLNLKKGGIALNRPQEPKPPYNYYTEDFSFKTEDNLNIAGTLSLPNKNGNCPVVIIISGSGPQNRDGEMFGHKPYLVLADHLVKNGIGVLRFDERGVGQSEGVFADVTVDMLASDVESALKYLSQRKDINISQLGLIGHSIGGLIAPMIASHNDNIDFIVLMAAPGMNGDQLMLTQKAAYERGLGLTEMQIKQGLELLKGGYDIMVETDLLDQELKDTLNTFYTSKYGGMLPEADKNNIIESVTRNEFIGLIRSKPSQYLKNIKCPVLAINGDKDFQVVSSENLKAIESILKENGNDNITIAELKNLNHLFQESGTGLLDEYGKIEQTISPDALNMISKWIIGLKK